MSVQLVSLVLLALAVPLVAAQVWIIIGMLRAGGDGAGGEGDRLDVTTATGRVSPGSAWPSVSVIIPARDEAPRLPATLASLASIEYRGRWEVVLVDDRSSDGTAELMHAASLADPRVRVVTIARPSKRYAPKVNAVRAGILASSGDIIVTSDADCSYRPGWLSAMVSALSPGVAMVCGYVETDVEAVAVGGRVPWWARIEAADWFSLMLVSRSLLRFGKAYASSANNQAYTRLAFARAGGFGAGARAPSGDEDLLAQRLGGLAGQRVVFTAAPQARVRTSSAGSLLAFLRQRRRWVSRYRHVVHYRPGFIAGLSVLGFESIALVAGLLASPFAPALLPVVLGVYLVQTAAHVFGMTLGARQLGRRDLGGSTALVWALMHPFIIATAVIWSWLAPGDWRAGASDYRRSLVRRRWRLLLRTLVPRDNADV